MGNLPDARMPLRVRIGHHHICSVAVIKQHDNPVRQAAQFPAGNFAAILFTIIFRQLINLSGHIGSAVDWNFLVQSIIAMVVITAPPDPAKIVFFNAIIDRTGMNRMTAALTVAGAVAVILCGAALIGDQVASLLGIDLNAFRVVGGIVVAGMGFEMLYGGAPSKTQGKDSREEGPDEDSGLIMPLSIPLIAGPGAIVTAVSIASSNEEYGELAALIGGAVVAGLCFVTFMFLGGLIARLRPRTTALLLRIGGLLLATIGTQMLLGGLKQFFEVGAGAG